MASHYNRKNANIARGCARAGTSLRPDYGGSGARRRRNDSHIHADAM